MRHERAIAERPQQLVELGSNVASSNHTTTVCFARYAFSATRHAIRRRASAPAVSLT
jgi:hypothetical protein